MNVNQKKFSDAIAIGARACAGKAVMPILGCVLIQAKASEGRVYIASTNLDTTISASAPAVVTEDLAVCVNGPRFSSIVAALGEDTVGIEVNPRFRVTMTCGRSTFKVNGLPASDFPTLPEIKPKIRLSFRQEEIAARVESVSPAQSRDEGRFPLNGMLLEEKSGKLILVATDGRRMHANMGGAAVQKSVKLVLPAAAINRLGQLLSKGTLDVDIDDRFVRFVIGRTDGDIVFTTKLVDANYPDWQRVIVNYPGPGIKLSCAEFAGAVRRALLMEDTRHAVKLTVKNSLVSVSCDGGSDNVSESIACENAAGFSGHVFINGRYLLDAIEGGTADDIVMKLSDKAPESSPVSLNGGDLSVIVMPVKLA